MRRGGTAVVRCRRRAKVDGEDLGVVPNVLRRALGQNFPVMQYRDPIRDGEDNVHVVFDYEQSYLTWQCLDQIHHADGFGGRHPRRGLVQEQQARAAGERDCDLQLPLLAVGQVAR